MSQFVYKSDDIVNVDYAQFDPSTLIMALIAIEREVPGTLLHIFRAAALANDGWRITTTSSNPTKSLACQRELIEWLEQFQQALDGQKGVQ